MPFNILSVAFHASFTAVSTGVTHYLGKKPVKTEPAAHFSYHSGLKVVRRFLEHAARHTVEELQAFTGQKVPASYWVATGSVIIPAEQIESAAHILVAQLGPEGVSLVGGSKWWQWRDTEAALVAEWLETRRDYNDRRARKAKSNRIILYIHGGAYFFGSVETHRYQLQRHARKLKARVFARQACATAQSAHVEDYATSELQESDGHRRNTQMLGELLRVEIDGATIEIKDQIHLYTTNKLISHPLVSPVLQPSLGGLPPLLVISGGGELLRDEQIYLAHKAANPEAYPPNDDILAKYDPDRKILSQYKPTYVQLQVWNNICHVAPTLSFTRPAKYMYRSVAQFSAWALSRAQESSIDIPDSSPASSGDLLSNSEEKKASNKRTAEPELAQHATIGKAGDPIPPFQNHMIRQLIDSEGHLLPLPDEHDLPALQVPRNHIGVPKPIPVRRWLAAKEEWDSKFIKEKRRLQKERLKRIPMGIDDIAPGDRPPPSSRAARRGVAVSEVRQPTKKSVMLSFWNRLGAIHDAKIMQKEKKNNVENKFPTLWRGGVQGEQRAAANVSRPSGQSKTQVVTDIGQSNESQRDFTTKPSRAIPEASVPQIWRSPSSEELGRTRSPRRNSESQGFVRDEGRGQNEETPVDSLLDEASIRTIRHSKGIISPPPLSAAPLSDYESVLQPGPYSGDDKTTVGVPTQKNEGTPGESDAVSQNLPGGVVNRMDRNKLPMFDFESATGSNPRRELEPFPSLLNGSGGGARDNQSGYSSNYSQQSFSGPGNSGFH
ncbi:lipase/esterase family protein [Trichophyton equinum CBS 127.97]|uniref:Lipase/esterase family protein n=1 Tax=Trichophyton equinum (strain ATCC MYA-4606 / CBS 127.97) TaxID=559882 RepID=F2PP79_TRIEC|nr:lipase/esterase family protein [Trichophyton equinum CBS 127.97]